MPGSGSAEAEAAATYLREQVPAFGNPSSHRTPEASCHINISFSVSETADGTDFDREYLRQYVDLRDYLSLATNYSFCLCKPWLPLCSHAVGKMGHPLYMIAAHRRGEFPGELLQPPRAFGHCRKWVIFYTPTHPIVQAWNLGFILESSISLTATSDQSPSTCSFIFWIFCQSILPSVSPVQGVGLLSLTCFSPIPFSHRSRIKPFDRHTQYKAWSHQQYEKYHGVLFFLITCPSILRTCLSRLIAPLFLCIPEGFLTPWNYRASRVLRSQGFQGIR